MASTFYSLLELADLTSDATQTPTSVPPEPDILPEPISPNAHRQASLRADTTLHYNIQIHLPATKDVEVFNAIFKSLKEHLLE